MKVMNKYENQTYARLGYTYGVKSCSFGGLWSDQEGNEVAAALNSELRMAPIKGTETATSEQLRSVRPTEF